MKTIRKPLMLSDLLMLISIYSKDSYELSLFDPVNRVELDVEFPLFKSGKESQKILVTTASETISYKGSSLEDFDMIFDFGKASVSESFKCKKLNHINNPNQSMRWIFSTSTRIASFLSFYSTATTKAKLIAKTIQILFKSPLRRLVCPGEFTIWHKHKLRIDELVDNIPHQNYSVFLGSKDINRTILIELNTDKKTTHFIKFPTNEHSEKSIGNEKKKLLEIAEKKFQTFCVPKVVGVNENALATYNIKPPKAYQHDEMTSLHHRMLHEIIYKTDKYRELEKTAFCSELSTKLSELNGQKKYQKILDKLERLKDELFQENKRMHVAWAHGDFTPWNIYASKHKLFVYDWELAKEDAPLLYDLFHFYFQSGILLHQHPIWKIKEDIFKACESPVIREIIVSYDIDVVTNYRFYLLSIIPHYLHIFIRQKELTIQHQWLLDAYENLLSHEVGVFKTMNSSREKFIESFNEYLKYKAHAFLKFVEGRFENLDSGSDLDILVMKEDIQKLIDFCAVDVNVERIKTHRKSFMTIVEIFFRDQTYLSLDLIHDFKRKGLKMLDPVTLLSLASPNENGITIPPFSLDFEYCFLFYTLNNMPIPERYVKYYREKNAELDDVIFRHIRKKYKLPTNNFRELLFENISFRSKVKFWVKKYQKNKSWSGLLNQWNYLRDTLRDLLNRKGMVITFSGVDGAGKTTIIEMVRQNLQKKYRREVVLLRHRPGILPILSAVKHGKERAEQIASVTMPRQGKNKNIISSLFRFAYYFFDYLVGQVYVYFKYVLRGKIVLYDRYYFDFINDSKRSNIKLNRGFVKGLYWFIFKPKLNFFLYADAETILARKKEMIVPEIDHLTQLYKNLFNQMNQKYPDSQYQIIENKELNLTLNTILKTYSKIA